MSDPEVPDEEQPASAPADSGDDSNSGDGESAAREDASSAPDPEGEPSLEAQLAERTEDLQRLAAEYKNYRVRAEREREAARAIGADKVLESLLTALDNVTLAEQHGQLEGGFKAVADELRAAVGKHGLESFGAKGDRFDPALHEAVTHAGESADVDVTSVELVMRTGYRVGDRVLRTAIVGVIDPAGPAQEQPVDEAAAEQSASAQAGDTDD